MQLLIVLSALVGLALGIVGPSFPVRGYTAVDCVQENQMFADTDNMCWFHRCVRLESGQFRLSPQACAGGSYVSDNYLSGIYNPCTNNFLVPFGWECERRGVANDNAPACASDGSVTCYNGGTLTYEADYCWCLCPSNWLGENDCSKPTGDLNPPNYGGNVCVFGQPKQDWCSIYGGCLNGGTCYNQCDDYWCDCPNRSTLGQTGKRCETYQG